MCVHVCVCMHACVCVRACVRDPLSTEYRVEFKDHNMYVVDDQYLGTNAVGRSA